MYHDKNILLVEDEYILALSECKSLEKYGYKVFHVSSGEKAIDFLNKGNKIDLILMDIDLQDNIDGTETAEIILKDHDLPIVFLSSHTEKEIVEKTENITSYGYVVKSSGIVVLDASIKMAFKLFEAHKKIERTSSILYETDRIEEEVIKSQQLTDIISNTIQDAVIMIDDKDKIIFWNTSAKNLFGYSEEEAIGKSLHGLLAPLEYKEKYERGLEKFRHTGWGDAIGNITEVLALTSDSKIVNIELSLAPFEHKKGVYYAIGVARNITEKKQTSLKLEKLLYEKDILLKEVHHRIKNNMSTIISLLSLQSLTLKNKVAICALEDASSRIQSMMILYDKLYRNEYNDSLSIKVYLETVLDEFINSFSMGEDLNIIKDIDNIDIGVKHIQSLGMIINEILTNISKYAFDSNDVKIVVIRVKISNDNLLVAIHDNGKGMPDSIDFNNTTGFGLTLIKSLVDQLKGIIYIDRSHGTKITMQFPLSQLGGDS